MAIQINTTISVKGITVPSGAIVIPTMTLRQPILGVNGGGGWDGTKVIPFYIQVPVYGSKALFQDLEPAFSEVDTFPPSFSHNLTDQEYATLTLDSAQEIVKTWIEGYTGAGTCSIIDEFLIE